MVLIGVEKDDGNGKVGIERELFCPTIQMQFDHRESRRVLKLVERIRDPRRSERKEEIHPLRV